MTGQLAGWLAAVALEPRFNRYSYFYYYTFRLVSRVGDGAGGEGGYMVMLDEQLSAGFSVRTRAIFLFLFVCHTRDENDNDDDKLVVYGGGGGGAEAAIFLVSRSLALSLSFAVSRSQVQSIYFSLALLQSSRFRRWQLPTDMITQAMRYLYCKKGKWSRQDIKDGLYCFRHNIQLYFRQGFRQFFYCCCPSAARTLDDFLPIDRSY